MKTIVIRLIALLLTSIFVTSVRSTPYMALGKAIEIVPPTGYCSLGETEAERNFFEEYKNLSAPAGLILQVAVPCPALKQFNAKTLDHFPRMATVMVVKARGQLKLDPRTRQDFIRGLGSPGPLDLRAVNTRLRAALANKGTTASLSSMTPIGADSLAFYWSGIGIVQSDGLAPRKVASVVAAMLVNSLPISIAISETEGNADGPAPASLAQQQVNAINARNENSDATRHQP